MKQKKNDCMPITEECNALTLISVSAVFVQLLQQIQASCRMVPTILCSTDRVTVFQFFTYLNRWGLADFGEHISRLSKEGRPLKTIQ